MTGLAAWLHKLRLRLMLKRFRRTNLGKTWIASMGEEEAFKLYRHLENLGDDEVLRQLSILDIEEHIAGMANK